MNNNQPPMGIPDDSGFARKASGGAEASTLPQPLEFPGGIATINLAARLRNR
jgi:hypothetical protein